MSKTFHVSEKVNNTFFTEDMNPDAEVQNIAVLLLIYKHRQEFALH